MNLIVSEITSQFKAFVLFREPQNKYVTLSVAFNFDKDGSNLSRSWKNSSL